MHTNGKREDDVKIDVECFDDDEDEWKGRPTEVERLVKLGSERIFYNFFRKLLIFDFLDLAPFFVDLDIVLLIPEVW